MSLQGADAVRRTLLGIAASILGIEGECLTEEATSIMVESLRICPRDTGELRSTAMISPPAYDRNGAAVVLSYGSGLAGGYAWYVHEMEGAVNWTTPGTGAKYLERPVLEARRGFAERQAARIERRLAARFGRRS